MYQGGAFEEIAESQIAMTRRAIMIQIINE